MKKFSLTGMMLAFLAIISSIAGTADAQYFKPNLKPGIKLFNISTAQLRSLYGMNLAEPNYYAGIRYFSNLAKNHRPQVLGGGGDAGDFPTADMDITTGVATIRNVGTYSFLTPANNPTDRIRVRWQGTSDIQIRGDTASNISTVANDGTYNYIDLDPSTIPGNYVSFSMSGTSADPKTITFLDAREVNRPLSEKFDPAFIAAMSEWSYARFMDWFATNATSSVNFTENYRPKPNHVFRAANWGMSIEDAIDLAAAANVDPWICIPHKVNQGYINFLVDYVQAKLPAARQVDVEYSNEIWNPQFSIFHDLDTEWKASNADLGSPANTYSQQALNHIQIMTWLEARAAQVGASVGDTGRFRRILGVQMGGGPNMDFLLDRPNLSAHYDRGAMAPYFGNTYNEAPVTTDVPTNLLKMTTSTTGGGIDFITGQLLTMKAQFDARSKPMIFYEAGSHMINVPVSVSHSIHYDPLMKPLFSYYLREVSRAVPGAPFVHFTNFGPISIYGPWGLRENINETAAQSPRYGAMVDAKVGIFTAPPLTIVNAPLPLTQGQPYTFSVDARWGDGPRGIKVYSATGSVPGLPFNTTTGLFSGTPSTPGNFNVTVNVTDVTGTASKPLTFAVAAAETYAYDDDARGTGNLPATGAGSSRMGTRGWQQDLGYAANGSMHLDAFRSGGDVNRYGIGINSLNRKVIVELNTTTWTGMYDNARIDVVAPATGEYAKSINLYLAKSNQDTTSPVNFLAIQKDGSYFVNIGKIDGDNPIVGTISATFVDGILKVFYNGNQVGDIAGYNMGTDYLPTQAAGYQINFDPLPYANKPPYSRFALRPF